MTRTVFCSIQSFRCLKSIWSASKKIVICFDSIYTAFQFNSHTIVWFTGDLSGEIMLHYYVLLNLA